MKTTIFRYYPSAAVFFRLIVLTLISLSAQKGMAQPAGSSFFPAGDTLFFTQIDFRWPQDRMGQTWLEISEDASFRNQVVSWPGAESPFLVSEGLTFCKTYYWRLINYQNGLPQDTSFRLKFSIGCPPGADPEQFRHRVMLNKMPTTAEMILAIDKPGVWLNLEGEPVWAFPDTVNRRVFDLQLLPTGDIAYLRPKGQAEGNENLAFEVVDLQGNLVWRAPDTGEVSGDTAEYYHHAWQRLANGHFIIAGTEFVTRYPAGAGGPVFCKLGTLIEYDPQGKVVWSWKLSAHIRDEDLFQAGWSVNPAHLNGFFVDEGANKVYISLRYLDTLFEVNRSTGEAERVYGGLTSHPRYAGGWGLFHQQHSPVVKDGFLWIFDNGRGVGADSVSSLKAFRMPAAPGDSLELYWHFPLWFGSRRFSFAESKGDIDRIGQGYYLVTMGATPRTALIDSGAGMVWIAAHEQKAPSDTAWQPVTDNYRAHWAPDLYPVRFRARITAPASGKDWTLTLENLGWVADGYAVQWPARRKKDRYWQIPPLQPGEVREIQLPQPQEKGTGVVFSQTNPRFLWKFPPYRS